METIADRLQRLRKAKGLTQPQLAALASVSQGTIGNIEGGTRKYGASIVNIAKVLEVSPEYLRCETNKADPTKSHAGPTEVRALASTRIKPSLLPGIDFSKVEALDRDDQIRLEGAWLDAAARLKFDVAAPHVAKRKSA